MGKVRLDSDLRFHRLYLAARLGHQDLSVRTDRVLAGAGLEPGRLANADPRAWQARVATLPMSRKRGVTDVGVVYTPSPVPTNFPRPNVTSAATRPNMTWRSPALRTGTPVNNELSAPLANKPKAARTPLQIVA
jgi:hypothetical protein